MKNKREVELTRKTRETNITIKLNIDGTGKSKILRPHARIIQ